MDGDEDPIQSRPSSIARLLALAAQARKPMLAPSALRVSSEWRKRTQRVLVALEASRSEAAATASATGPLAGAGWHPGAAAAATAATAGPLDLLHGAAGVGGGACAVRARRLSKAGPGVGVGVLEVPPGPPIPLVACRDPGELTQGARSPSKAAARTALGDVFQATVSALSPTGVRWREGEGGVGGAAAAAAGPGGGEEEEGEEGPGHVGGPDFEVCVW
jgi:hypothetical protein